MCTIAKLIREVLPPDWDGDESVLVCPCGYTIEHDGECPEGCVSPILEMGMI